MKQIKLALERFSQSYLLPKEVSVPLCRGMFNRADVIKAVDQDGRTIPILAAKPLSNWDDGSIKWLRLQLDLASVDSDELVLDLSQGESAVQKPATMPDANSIFERLTPRLTVSGIERDLVLTSVDGQCKASFESQDKRDKVRIQLEIQSLGHAHCFKILARIHNYGSAKHPGGLWDLGDPGSFEFDSFELFYDLEQFGESDSQILEVSNEQVVTDVIAKKSYSAVGISQFSSGGENWNCRNHVNKENVVPLTEQGYQAFYFEGQEQKRIAGKRIQPILAVESANGAIALSIEKFWQNFPTSLRYSENSVCLGFFPKQAYQYELQAGERKTFEAIVDLEGRVERVVEGMQSCHVKLCPSHVAESNVLPLFENSEGEVPLYQIINSGLESDNNFFAKREQIDEYGWRHFGDLFADHECYGEKGKTVQFSHYNNQYDPIWGFLRQYLKTGESRWFDLADDLAKHVLDIDIYRTNLDRDEYNNGLFWHTDHYSDAATCSHRTFSKHHSEVYEGYQSGGGPGGQHCYTLGLALYYFLTGNEDSKQTVTSLADWIGNLYEGSPTILGTLYAIKRSSAIGVKNVVTGIYPLDRGTGNYINALIDSYEVSGDNTYAEQAFSIISNTLHPLDNLDELGLDNIELTWFYSVLLQSVIRFMELKRSQDAIDQDFYYCRDVLNTYVNWMRENEKPYLEQVEKLEFPNLTWAAQDLRRANIFYAASYYCDESFVETGDYYHQYLVDKLSDAEERSHTRILALIMQNIGAKAYFGELSGGNYSSKHDWPIRKRKVKALRVASLLLRALSKLSIKRELDWLRVRSSKAEQYLGEKSDG